MTYPEEANTLKHDHSEKKVQVEKLTAQMNSRKKVFSTFEVIVSVGCLDSIL